MIPQVRSRSAYLFGVVDALKVNKCESPGASSALVVDDVDAGEGSVAGEDLPQVALCGVETQAKHTKAGVGVWVGLQGAHRQNNIHDTLTLLMYASDMSSLTQGTPDTCLPHTKNTPLDCPASQNSIRLATSAHTHTLFSKNARHTELEAGHTDTPLSSACKPSAYILFLRHS